MGYGRTEEINMPIYCNDEVMDVPVVHALGFIHERHAAAVEARKKAIADCELRGGNVNHGIGNHGFYWE